MAGSVLVGGVLLAVPAVQSAAPAGAGTGERVSAAGADMAFSHMVPTDPQRLGFEPNVLVDSADRVFSTAPNGFSTTMSFLWSSIDHGKSFQLAPGNIGGKPTTCPGGGDTELAVDLADNLFFSDLQGLTNLSNSVSSDQGATWTTNCAAAPNTPVDRMWYAIRPGTKLGDANFQIYEDYDAVNSTASANNALVETVSTDGVTFLPVTPTGGPDPTCGGGAVNCVTADEGISGNQVFSPDGKNLYIAHTDSTGTRVVVSKGVLDAAGTSATWTHVFLPNPPGFVCDNTPPSLACIDPSSSDNEVEAGDLFPVVAVDGTGHVYAVFASQQLNHTSGDLSEGSPTAPEQIWISRSDNQGTTWSTPQQVSTTGTNTMPWIAAGDDGRVDVAWYHTDSVSEQGPCAQDSTKQCTNIGPEQLLNAEWSVQMAQSLNAAAVSPTWSVSTVSEHSVKHGQICLNGLGCATGGDRSLGDFLQVKTDNQGAAVLSFVDDTSNAYNGGEASGPAVIVRQISGPSLKASVGTISGPGSGPGVPVDSVTDAVGDANFSANGTRTLAGDNLDVTGASMSVAAGQLVVTMKVKGLADFATSAGGSNGNWMVRWTQVDPTQPGNGHIYFAGMESDGGGAPTFYDGDANCGIFTTHCKQIGYPHQNVINGSVDKAAGTITLNVPLPDIGSPPAGTVLYSAVASTFTSNQTFNDPTNTFNVIDAAEPFNFTIPAQVFPPGAGGPSIDRAAPGCLGTGYWSDASDGGIFTFGEAAFFGSEGGHPLNKSVVSMAHTPSCNGYWLVATDGGLFAHGDARFFGSTGGMKLNQPVVGMAATPSGLGYWLVASDGGIFAFGDAQFFGSMGDKHLNKPIVGIAATPSGRGYWMVATDGGIFSFGDATFLGSEGAKPLNQPIVAMARTNDGGGYYLVASDGGIFAHGNAPFLGSEGARPLNKPIVGMAVLTTGPGYWLVASDGGIFTHGNAPFLGSMGGTKLTRPMVGMASH